MDEFEKIYFEQRAEEPLAFAQSATHPAAVRAHYEMAIHYLDRIYGHDIEVVTQIPGDRWSGPGRY